jgi:hypothetical protein
MWTQSSIKSAFNGNARFDELALKYSGEYDGWEAAL